MNETADDPELAIELMTRLSHPEAKTLLWRVAKGCFGPDLLRLRAFGRLEALGAVKGQEGVEILVKGERRKIVSMAIKLNPEFRFGPRLPPKLDKQYAAAVRAGQGAGVNWAKNGEAFKLIMQEAPAFYPARFNYAVSLLQRGNTGEAEPLLRALAAAHPDYLFVRGLAATSGVDAFDEPEMEA